MKMKKALTSIASWENTGDGIYSIIGAYGLRLAKRSLGWKLDIYFYNPIANFLHTKVIIASGVSSAKDESLAYFEKFLESSKLTAFIDRE